ncbi:MAG: efflux RND transporter periplasmic adaptor subunit [Acidobacteria bacterium]|nr:efflux RND transporter periplasmic adaptor subunit [Acidobacteriota bacterium]
MKKIVILLLIAIAGFSVSCSINFTRRGKDKKKDSKEIVVPVQVETLKTGPISSFILSSGTVKAEMSVDIVAETAGVVEKLNVEEGDRVKKGQILAVVNFEELKLSKDKAEVALKEAENTFKRTRNMFDRQLVSQEDYDNARFNYNQKKLDFENARVRFEKSMIKAPFSGIITERFITAGQYLTMNQKAFSLVNRDVLKVNVFIPEERVHELKVNMPAKLISEAAGQTYNGKVKRISHVVDPATGTVKVTVYVKHNPDIRPGMFVKVRLLTDTVPNALLVPKKAVVYQNDRQFVFLYNSLSHKAKKVELKTGYQDESQFQALNKDLKPGDKVIVAGQNGLKDGAKVRLG